MRISTLELDSLTMQIVRKRIKNTYFRVYPPDGAIKVTAPLHLAEDELRKQIATKHSWLVTQQAKFRTQTNPSPIIYASGEQHDFLGKRYTLIIKESSSPGKIIVDNQFIHCYTKPTASREYKQKLLENWYKQQMQEQIPSLIAKWEPIISVTVNSWTIKPMKSRWGSCNIYKKHLCLNLNLIKKPLACLEYVLVHEMVHLLEASHNKRFYAFMDRFLPQWRNLKTILAD